MSEQVLSRYQPSPEERELTAWADAFFQRQRDALGPQMALRLAVAMVAAGAQAARNLGGDEYVRITAANLVRVVEATIKMDGMIKPSQVN